MIQLILRTIYKRPKEILKNGTLQHWELLIKIK